MTDVSWVERPDGGWVATVDRYRLRVAWDDQDPQNEGWAYRVDSPDCDGESGPCDSVEEN